MATGAEIEPLALHDLVPELRRDIHITSLTDAFGNCDHSHTAATGEDKFITFNQITFELHRNGLTSGCRLRNRLLNIGELHLQFPSFFAPGIFQFFQFLMFLMRFIRILFSIAF